MSYFWQHKNWPHFKYKLSALDAELVDFTVQVGHVSGMLLSLPELSKTDILIQTLVAEAVKTSEIEGEYISRKDVMSSIKNNMGLYAPEKVSDDRATGISALMLDVRNSYAEELTEQKLMQWHQMLMQGNTRINVGQWRTHQQPMQVVSGSVGKETVHFEAPLSSSVPHQMEDFIKWFNNTAPHGKTPIKHAPVRSALAHLYFETIHPFEDGNGRIGRAIAEKALSQNVGRPILLSLSKAIELRLNDYYNALKTAQRQEDVTDWLSYFVELCIKAQADTEQQILFVIQKARFFDAHKENLNERQLKVIQKMLALGPDGFEGGMNARKYKSITGTSKATATRDLQYLLQQGVLKVLGDGRSTAYQLNI